MEDGLSNPEGSKRISFRRLLWVGPLAVLASVIANVLVSITTVALVGISPEFEPLYLRPVIGFTVVGVLGAVLVFALVARFSRRPVRLFRRIALVVLLLSFMPDLSLLNASPYAGTTVQSVIALMLMHVVAWLISVSLLTTLTRTG
jgi:hypothetical protein